MLREDDAVVMQRCVGNFSPATASLRMAAGQGVAGRVVATKQPCCVDNYVASNVISNDFVNLARDEMVRSALAAPLLSGDDVIGVLEVWRRQTTEFDEHHRSVSSRSRTSPRWQSKTRDCRAPGKRWSRSWPRRTMRSPSASR